MISKYILERKDSKNIITNRIASDLNVLPEDIKKEWDSLGPYAVVVTDNSQQIAEANQKEQALKTTLLELKTILSSIDNVKDIAELKNILKKTLLVLLER